MAEPTRTILLKLVIDGKEAIAELNLTEAEVGRLGRAFGSTTSEVEKHKGSVGGLAQYIREQRGEQRQANFLINDFRDALNLAGMAMNGMAMGGSREFKHLTESVNAGLVAFNGIDAVTGLLPGPMGLVFKLAGGIATAVYTWASATDTANESIKQHLLLLDQMNSKYDETRTKMTGSDRAVQETARVNAEVAERNKIALEGFLDEAVNGQKVETTYMGQRVSIRRKGLGTIKDLEKTYLTEYQLYQEEYRKAISEGKKGDDARSAALDALKAKVQSLIPYIAGLRAIANEGSTTGLMRTVDALSEALTLAKSLGSFKMQEVTFINDEQAKRFAEAVKQAEFLQVWMRQAPAMRADLVQENWIAQFKQLKTLGKDQLKQIPEAFHGMTQEMADDLKSWVNVSNQIIGVFSNSIRSGFEAAFRDDGGAGEFFKSILLGAIDLTQGLIMAATAAAAAKQVLTWGFSSFADIPLLAAATIGLQGLRAYIATAFAEGGVVDRPTLALVGERGEMEIITPQRKLEKFLREQLLPEVMRSENFVAMARQTSPAFAGGSLDGLRKDIRDLHGTLKQKNFSASFPGLVTIDEAFARTAPRVARRKARERK